MAKKRGPSYPGIGLPTAIERIRPVVNAEPHNPMSGKAAAIHLGYKGTSGASLSMLADMKRYALLEGRGDEIKVSRDALTIIMDENNEDQSERIEALKRCSTNDALFSKINSNFKGVPKPATLISYLTKDGLSPGSAKRVASNYTETMEFVDEQKKDYNTTDESNDKPQENDNKKIKQWPAEMKDIQLPYSNNAWATLRAPFPLNQAEWDQLIAVLQIMKLGLVAENKPAKEEESTDADDDIFS